MNNEEDRIIAELDRVIAECSEAIRLDPNDANAYIKRGAAYGQKEDWNQAIVECSEAIRLAPNNAKAYGMRGLVYKLKGDPDRAIADYTEAIRLDPNNAGDYYISRGRVYDDKKDWDRAIADYTEAIRLDPNNADAWYQRSLTYPEKGDMNRAIADTNEAIRLDPDNADYHSYLEKLLHAEGWLAEIRDFIDNYVMQHIGDKYVVDTPEGTYSFSISSWAKEVKDAVIHNKYYSGLAAKRHGTFMRDVSVENSTWLEQVRSPAGQEMVARIEAEREEAKLKAEAERKEAELKAELGAAYEGAGKEEREAAERRIAERKEKVERVKEIGKTILGVVLGAIIGFVVGCIIGTVGGFFPGGAFSRGGSAVVAVATFFSMIIPGVSIGIAKARDIVDEIKPIVIGIIVGAVAGCIAGAIIHHADYGITFGTFIGTFIGIAVSMAKNYEAERKNIIGFIIVPIILIGLIFVVFTFLAGVIPAER